MNRTDELAMIRDAIRAMYRDAGLEWPPAPSGPMPLGALIGSQSRLIPEEIFGLTRAAVSMALARWGVQWSEIPDPDPALAGFLYANERSAYLFVRRDDPLPRRRFSAAHELGHYRLHLAPALAGRAPAGAVMIEADENIEETNDAEMEDMERQANRFAAELLMPEAVCRSLHARYAKRHGEAARFLIRHLAGDLLVSRDAIGWRLRHLGLIAPETHESLRRAAESGEDE